jgi:uncharacterized phage protein (TIGR02218 family)
VRTLHAVSLSLLQNRTHRHAKLWLVERRDGVRKFLTNHDREVKFDSTRPYRGLGQADVQTYKPSGSFDTSAFSREGGRTSNKTLRGVVTTDEITDADLRAGRYLDAKITEFTVDYRFPMLGPIRTDVFWITSLERGNGSNVLDIEVRGLSRFLDRPRGDIVTRLCPYALGDDECQKDLTAMQRTDVVVATVTDRSTFTVTGSSLPEDTSGSDPDLHDDYFALGTWTWTTGSNTGVVSRIASFDLSTRTFTLRIPTPNDIAVADQGDANPGCNKQLEFCDSQFSNKDNFGGDKFVPGAHEVRKGPEFGITT